MFENGFHPIDALRERVSNMRAHPFQNIVSGIAGAVGGPLGGMASRGLFNRYNQGQFDNAANTNQARVTDQMGIDTNDAMNKPLNGPLGQFGNDNSQLAQALTGGPQGGGYGNPGGYNMSQNWNPQSFSGGSNVVQGILDQLPGGSNFTPLTHQEHLQNIENQQNQGGGMPGANYGVSNFMAGGSPVITGYMPDMNQKYLKGKY